MADTPKEDNPEKTELPPAGWLDGNTATTPLPPTPIHLAARGMAACATSASFVAAWTAPLPEDHVFYRNVGRVASEWSHLEHALDVAIWELSGTKPEIASCITAQIMGVGPRCKTIMNLASHFGMSSAELKPLRTLMSRTHSRWLTKEPVSFMILGISKCLATNLPNSGQCPIVTRNTAMSKSHKRELTNSSKKFGNYRTRLTRSAAIFWTQSPHCEKRAPNGLPQLLLGWT